MSSFDTFKKSYQKDYKIYYLLDYMFQFIIKLKDSFIEID